jgi:PAS domain S-box-containing protein
MLVSPRRAWACIGAGTVVAAGLFTAYLGMRAFQLEPEPTVFKGILGVGFLAGCAASIAIWIAWRDDQRVLKELSAYVAALRQDASLEKIRALPAEYGPLYDELDALAQSYRKALANLVHQTDAVETLRLEQQQADMALGRADAEQGRSLFRVRRGGNDSRTMVVRLTPTLHWMVSTPALQQFLGYSLGELNGRSFLDMVHQEDIIELNRAFQEALETGEAHNIIFRVLRHDGEEQHVQMDVLTRYTQESTPLHLRCHFLDITHRVRTDEQLRNLADALRLKAEELQQANTQLLRINRELDDFSYVVSHDLKEPLRTLEAFSTFLEQDYGNQLGQEGQEFISHLIQASRRLGALIDDLLTLSRAGRVINSAQAFRFKDMVETVRGDLADLILRKHAVVHIEAPLPEVAGDPPRVIQLLINLVSNGLKYNVSPTPEVFVGHVPAESPSSLDAEGHGGAEADQEYVTLYVRDNGIGIAPQYHEQIFRIFRRLHRREEYEGTGAGLAICKKIIEAHGGRIWVESEVGAGATFYFTLPSARSAVSIQEAVDRGRNGDPATADRSPAQLLALNEPRESIAS